MCRVCFSFVFLACLAGLCAGCGGEEREAVEAVPVSGTVYLDGKPFEGAEIRFYTKDFVGFGVTGPDGTYQLSQGAEPGENRVTIDKVPANMADLDPEGGMDLGQLEAEQEAAAGPGVDLGRASAKLAEKQGIPAQYSDPEKTQLKVDIPEDGKEGVDFRVTSK